MTRGPTGTTDTSRFTVPPPEPPASPGAWYAPAVRRQYEIRFGVVATVRAADGTDGTFRYQAREPSLAHSEAASLARVRAHFEDARVRRPLTRQGVVERAAAGFEPKYERALSRLLTDAPGPRRRLDYHALRDLRLLGAATPLALDGEVEVADAAAGADGRLVVHTAGFAPAVTDLAADADHVDRVASERLAQYTVDFVGSPVPVVVYRDGLLGNDRFGAKYAVREPDLLPGDRALLAECKERVWEAGPDERFADVDRETRAAFVDQRARELLARRLTARNTRAWLAATAFRARGALADLGLAVPPVDERYAGDRLDDLVYYVLRDFVGEGPLTVPIRDPNLEDVEANRVGERVKVVPRGDLAGTAGRSGHHATRIPTNLVFDTETAFVNVVSQLAASDGVELTASTPSAKVNLTPAETDETIRCAVALPVVSEGGPHVSIRKQSAAPLTAVGLVEAGSLSADLVTLLWMLFEHRGVVLFSGPTGVGKTTLMNAHLPFVPFDDRPVSIDEGSREVRLPHETGISLTTRDHESPYKRVTMADLMTESNYLNPDIEVIAEINTPASFETFGEVLNTGHGVVGTTHAEDVDTLVNRVIEQGLPAYLLAELDLVVFPHRVGGDRYVARAVEFLSPSEYEALPPVRPAPDDGDHDRGPTRGVVEKGGATVHWNEVYRRTVDGEFVLQYDHPDRGDPVRRLGLRTFDRLAAATDRAVEDVEAEFRRKRQYVRFMVDRGVTDADELFDLLSNLRTDEAATVERLGAERTWSGAVPDEPAGSGPRPVPDGGSEERT